jgi:gluconokinase
LGRYVLNPAEVTTAPIPLLARPPILVVMGVSGAGKTLIAQMLADKLSCPMLEGDSLHSAANIKRMAAGIPLTDEDRHDWLIAIAQHITAATRNEEALVVTCSALKRRYRDILRGDVANPIFVHLSGDKALIASRLKLRRDHFMPGALLESQFATLETPGADELVIYCDVAPPPQAIVASIFEQLPRMIQRGIEALAERRER